MSTGKVDRLQALSSVRRAERASAFEVLGAAERDLERAREALTANRVQAADLLALLDAPLSEKRRGAEALATVLSRRQQQTAALASLDEALPVLRRHLETAERALDNARTEAAHAHNALKAVENRRR